MQTADRAPVKLADVAKHARVSVATVSRVLNKTGPVKTSTRARVMKAVKGLRYHPNLQARSLAGGKSHTVGMIVSNLENPFFVDIFRSLESAAHQHGYEVLVANTDYRPRHLVSSVHLMMGRRVEGLAVIVSEMEPSLMKELTELNKPVVFYDVGVPGPNICNIRVNYDKGIQKTAEYLYSLGHRRIAFVGHHTKLTPLLDREKSFLETMKRYSGEVEFTTATDRDEPEGGQLATRELFASGFRPTAIMVTNDFMALGALRELRERGLRVPEDVSVTGYDNIRLSKFTCPSLTTVDIPRADIGHLAFEALVLQSEAIQDRGREVTINPELVIRESTGPAPA
jgi:LacI family transcriptional regulator